MLHYIHNTSQITEMHRYDLSLKCTVGKAEKQSTKDSTIIILLVYTT